MHRMSSPFTIYDPRRQPFLAWPGGALLGYALLLALAQTVPFMPAFILGYLSMGLVFVPAPFILRSRQELRALACSLAAVTAVAGVGFLLLPAESAYPPRDADAWSGLFAIARGMALRHNMVPSLHVALSAVCLSAYTSRCGMFGKLCLAAWIALIALSTLLTHQHHLLDVFTGLSLALAGKRFVYDRLASSGA
jgi:membrane-associated phospholipid phosphatase